jgi:hypothetical protein
MVVVTDVARIACDSLPLNKIYIIGTKGYMGYNHIGNGASNARGVTILF